MTTTSFKNSSSFLAYCFVVKRKQLAFALVLNVLLVLGYQRFLYPMALFGGDTHRYIDSAQFAMDVNVRPAGYPYFLRALHAISPSLPWVVFAQYMLLVLAALFLYFTVDYLLRFRSVAIRNITFSLIVFNPLSLILSSLIGCDAFFAALAISWFALLLWVLLRANWWALLLSVILLFLTFQVWYNALYYPIIACAVFLAARNARWGYRLTGVALTIITIGATYHKIEELTLRHTGVDVFSGFSGWQIANNAMYIYKQAGVTKDEFKEPALREIDSFVTAYYAGNGGYNEQERAYGAIGCYFIWDKDSPLRNYFYHYTNTHVSFCDFDWYKLSVPLGEYGKRIIYNHPGAYFKYYIWPGVGAYLMPIEEVLNSNFKPEKEKWVYSMTYYNVPKEIIELHPSPKPLALISKPYKYLHILLVLLSVFAPLLLFFAEIKKRKQAGYSKLLLVVFWLVFYGGHVLFTLLTSVAILRIEAMWFVLVLGLPMWFLDDYLGSRKSAR